MLRENSKTFPPAEKDIVGVSQTLDILFWAVFSFYYACSFRLSAYNFYDTQLYVVL